MGFDTIEFYLVYSIYHFKCVVSYDILYLISMSVLCDMISYILFVGICCVI